MNSTQLDLWQSEVDAMPWGGRSPRSLTRVRMSLFFEQERQKHERFFVDENQVDMFKRAKKAPRIYRGAPLLQEVR